MKRKRKSGCPSPLLEDSPKRPKVHAQRKFAQGSNVNSPVITPIRELESESPKIDVLPEPVELLPIKRPNTEDFLTFLCFRGTPILPPSLNFFNTASIVDTNGQVHEIKSESSPKNGPIDIAKCGSSSEKPFIAFGVRKRADPIVISRQMDRKRRHALAIQALRRKYQEQKMAKIRALTISKLSEKVSNKTLVRTNTVSKTETVTKKNNTLQKTRVVATKHVKVTTQTLKTTLRPKVKPKMCLRSFRGRFVQKELPFRKKVVREKELIRKPLKPKTETKKKLEKTEISEGEENVLRATRITKSQPVFKVNRTKRTEARLKTSPRVTRSGISDKNVEMRRKQIKKRILITNPNTIIKPRSLRLTTLKKTVLSQKKCKSGLAKQMLRTAQKQQGTGFNKKSEKEDPTESVEDETDEKSFENARRNARSTDTKDSKQSDKKSPPSTEGVNKTTAIKKDYKRVTDFKKETNTFVAKNKKHVNKSIDIRKEVTKSTDIKKDANKTVEVKKSTRISNIVQKKELNVAKNTSKSRDAKPETVKKVFNKSAEAKRGSNISPDKEKKQTARKGTTSEIPDQTRSDEVIETANSKKVKSKSQESPINSTRSSDGGVLRIDYVKPTDLKKSKALTLPEELTKKVEYFNQTDVDVEPNENTDHTVEQKSVDIKKTKTPVRSEQDEKLKSSNVMKNKKNIAVKSSVNKVGVSANKRAKNKFAAEDSVSEKGLKTDQTVPNLKEINENINKLLVDKKSTIKSADTDSENDVKLSKMSKKPKSSVEIESVGACTDLDRIDKSAIIDTRIKPSSNKQDKINVSRNTKESVEVESNKKDQIRNETSKIQKNLDIAKIDDEKKTKKLPVNDKKLRSKLGIPQYGNSTIKAGTEENMGTEKNTYNKPLKTKNLLKATDVVEVENKLSDLKKKSNIEEDIVQKNEKIGIILLDSVKGDTDTSQDNIQNPKANEGNILKSLVACDETTAEKAKIELTNICQDFEVVDSTIRTSNEIENVATKADPVKNINDTVDENKIKPDGVKEVKKSTTNKIKGKGKSIKSKGQVEDCRDFEEVKTSNKVDESAENREVESKEKPTTSTQNLKGELKEIDSEPRETPKKVIKKKELNANHQEIVKDKEETIDKSSNRTETAKNLVDISFSGKYDKQGTFIRDKPMKTTPSNKATATDIISVDDEEKSIKSEELSDKSINETKATSIDRKSEPVKVRENTDINISESTILINSPEVDDNVGFKSDDELMKLVKKPSSKLSASSSTSKLKNFREESKFRSTGKVDETKKGLNRTFLKKVKGKSMKYEALEDLEDLMNITDKMKKLETGSEADEISDLGKKDKFLGATSEKEKSKSPENKVDIAKVGVGKKSKTLNTVEEQDDPSEKVPIAILMKDSQTSGEKSEGSSSKNVQVDTYKMKKEHLKKEISLSRKDVDRKKVTDKEDTVTPKIMQRPSRKSKEAATIYMEILSHKLVNDNQVDDDNVSIDSFPELPNVKKTEQRENELKAQAKSSKDDPKEKPKVREIDKTTVSGTEKEKSHNKIKFIDKSIIGEKEAKISSISETVLFPVEEIPDDMKLNELKSKLEVASVSKQENASKLSGTKRKSPGYRISYEETQVTSDPDSDGHSKRTKLRKSDSFKSAENEEEVAQKRPIRNPSKTSKAGEGCASDESFHIDTRVPRKKKVTRSRRPGKPLDMSVEKIVSKVSPASKRLSSSSDSDQSTTSDINLQTLANKAKNKKFSKTKSMKKTEMEFSDSDEEPLSRLTNQSVVGSHNSGPQHERAKEESISKPVTKAKSLKMSPKLAETEVTKSDTKPKRECAKIPQNYLPMLSSSDEDEIFHGFDEKNVKSSKAISAMIPTCSHTPPLLDLLHKDRFGKEKVNMSNEQIEKWLKDSALAGSSVKKENDELLNSGKGKVNMSNEQIEKWLKDSALAGSSVKKENDEMLKFGERIPTESTFEMSEHIDTEKLKLTLLEESKPEDKPGCSSVTPDMAVDKKAVESAKPQLDRKLIFRKCKKDSAPNINAFSPENESSVYAFGEDNEDVISTPFRRPSRRPSSTATSRSEDESSRHDDSLKAGQFRKPTLKQDLSRSSRDDPDPSATEPDESSHFYIPQKPSKHAHAKLQGRTLLKTSKSAERLSDLDDFKYKVPSSPSASSSSSAKLSKKPAQKQKNRPAECITPVYVSDFPKKTDPARLVEAPVFHPTDQEFQDPLEYIERIRHKAEQFGICRIIPPSGFKPECKVSDDMRFTAYDQYVHKMLYRWGPNFKELMAIKKYLETQNISLVHPPWIGGMEIDLPRLYQTVQTLGGLKEVIEKKRWPRVSELMKIPKSAQDRVTKLDDIYCKYLLPYDTLSPAEREKLFDEVETEWAKRESRNLMKLQQKSSSADAVTDADSEDFEDNDVGECITKGRNMALNGFYRIARNTMSMHFKNNEPAAQEVEQEYWKHVSLRQNHICVHSGSIDCGNWGYGFATTKNSPFARHPWNLKVLTNNNGSVLRSLGPIMGVTVPTLHVGMVFSACCWYRDPHGLPWIEYLHTGGNKIWYGVPDSAGDAFQTTLRHLVPSYCKEKELWLPSDTVMVPPSLLVENDVSLCRTIQEPGQFVVVFPKAFTSSISTGYVVSESVYFAPTYWLKTARSLFDALRNSSEPSMFSLDRLLISIATDGRCGADVLTQATPHVRDLCDREMARRARLGAAAAGMTRERLPAPEANRGKRRRLQRPGDEGDYECDVCKMSLFVSMVFDTQEGLTYCLDHGIEMIETKKIPATNCKFMFTYDDDEVANLPDKMKTSIETKLQKKVPNKYAGMPTLLNKLGNQ